MARLLSHLRSGSCFIGEVNNPWARTCCISIATTISLAAIYGTYKSLNEKTIDAIMKPINFIVKPISIPLDFLVKSHPLVEPIFTMSLIPPVSYFLWKFSKNTYQEVSGSTKCCNIIRSTALYICVAPITVFIIGIFVYCANCSRQKYFKK